jgi:tRNA(Ile)-lysidine synthase
MRRRQGEERTEGRPSGFARRLLAEWRRRAWASAGEGVVVAVSGGADSTALLLALDELSKACLLDLSLTVAHLDHGLRGERSEEDARWVEELAGRLGHGVVSKRASVGERAGAGRDNLEQAARRARYEFLAEAARAAGAGAVVAAHTLDDQAETVLLNLLRGSGAEGLGGIRAERRLAESSEVLLLRPLVGWARRADTEGYCGARGVEFRADEMNDDERFARVRVRRRLVPLLETFNPRAAEALARTAELVREDAAALEQLAARLLEEATREAPEVVDDESAAVEDERAGAVDVSGARPLRVGVLAGAAASLRRRALRQWIARGRGDLRRVELAHVVAVERLLAGARGGRVAELPGGARVERRRGWLFFRG